MDKLSIIFIQIEVMIFEASTHLGGKKIVLKNTENSLR